MKKKLSSVIDPEYFSKLKPVRLIPFEERYKIGLTCDLRKDVIVKGEILPAYSGGVINMLLRSDHTDFTNIVVIFNTKDGNNIIHEVPIENFIDLYEVHYAGE